MTLRPAPPPYTRQGPRRGKHQYTKHTWCHRGPGHVPPFNVFSGSGIACLLPWHSTRQNLHIESPHLVCSITIHQRHIGAGGKRRGRDGGRRGRRRLCRHVDHNRPSSPTCCLPSAVKSASSISRVWEDQVRRNLTSQTSLQPKTYASTRQTQTGTRPCLLRQSPSAAV